jgi:AraC family transcriptional regulator
MNPRIETLSETKLVGKRIKMSMSDNKTVQLWQSFMPLRKTIKDSLTSDLFSMQVYDPSFDFRDFDSEVFF